MWVVKSTEDKKMAAIILGLFLLLETVMALVGIVKGERTQRGK